LEFLALRPCKGDMFEAVPKERLQLDLARCAALLARAGFEVVSDAGVMLTVRKEVEITLYPHGRLMVFPVKTREEAARFASEVYSIIGT
jgi:ArsR family metal-binding transcriptional regulator